MGTNTRLEDTILIDCIECMCKKNLVKIKNNKHEKLLYVHNIKLTKHRLVPHYLVRVGTLTLWCGDNIYVHYLI